MCFFFLASTGRLVNDITKSIAKKKKNPLNMKMKKIEKLLKKDSLMRDVLD